MHVQAHKLVQNTHTHTQANIAKVVADAAAADLQKAKDAAEKMAKVNKVFIPTPSTQENLQALLELKK
jgi:hypothetical protein